MISVIDEIVICMQFGVKWLSSEINKKIVAATYGVCVRRESFE
jgi:hypothetical protein